MVKMSTSCCGSSLQKQWNPARNIGQNLSVKASEYFQLALVNTEQQVKQPSIYKLVLKPTIQNLPFCKPFLYIDTMDARNCYNTACYICDNISGGGGVIKPHGWFQHSYFQHCLLSWNLTSYTPVFQWIVQAECSRKLFRAFYFYLALTPSHYAISVWMEWHQLVLERHPEVLVSGMFQAQIGSFVEDP